MRVVRSRRWPDSPNTPNPPRSPNPRRLPCLPHLAFRMALGLVMLALGVSTGQAQSPSQDLLLPARYDTATGHVFLTIPRLGAHLLYLNTLATGFGLPSASLDRGETGIEALVHFERRGSRILLVRANERHVARGGSPALQRSAEESFPRSVLASFAIASQGPGGTVIDATDFFLSDVFDVIGRLRGARQGTLQVDANRSFIDGARVRSLPMNTEVRAVLSYVTDQPGDDIRRVAPDARSITLEQQHSFVRLPDRPLGIRPYDPRAGIFSYNYFDFAQGPASDYRQRGAIRWRLEPRDTAAYLRGQLVEPVKPIVYYLDPGIPEPYRTAFVEGGMWWNKVFEAAGWRNAFRVERLPDGVDPMDARYPVLYWVHREERGPSVGPAYVDPRTGEIVSTVVRMDSYRSLVDHDIYMGLVPAAEGRLALDATAFAMARRRQHVAHEIGHTLGLAHNYIASTQGRASVMDYPYPLVTLDAQGRIDVSEAYRPSGGAHDTLAIRYAYTWYPTAQAEREGLRRIVREAEQRGLRFVSDEHVGASGSIPGASQWVEGADMLSALERTMAVRRVLVERFDQRAAQPGEPLAVLNRRFAHVYLHHRYAMTGAIKTIGGMDFGYALAGERTVSTAILPAAEQRRALRLVLSALAPAELRVPDRVAALIPPVPPGYDNDLTLIPTPAGTAFDPLALAHSFAQEVVDGLLNPERAARVVSFHAREAANLSLDEVLAALVEATWGAPAAAGGSQAVEMGAALRRVAQRAVLDGMLDLAGNAAATSEVRAVVGQHLERLRQGLEPRTEAGAGTGAGASPQEIAHRAQARRDLERYFAGRDDRALRPRPGPIALPWP